MKVSRRLIAPVISMLVLGAASPAAATAGGEVWAKRYDGPVSGEDSLLDTAVSPNGAVVFATGVAASATMGDLTTVAYSASDGTQLWRKRYNGPADGWDVGTAIAVSPDGSVVFVTGGSDGTTSNRDYYTVAYSATDGTRLWARRYDRVIFDQANALQVAPDGQAVFVTGMSYESSVGEYVTIAYAATDGTTLWTKVTNGVAQANALVVSPDGTHVFIAGAVPQVTIDLTDYITMSLDASTGEKVWGVRFKGKANGADYGAAVGVSPDGTKIYVTGRSEGVKTPLDFATVSYRASDGAERWVRRFDGPAHDADAAGALSVAPDGSRIVVVGTTDAYAAGEYATVAYDQAGTQRWVKLYDGPVHGASGANDVAITPDSGSVLVAGTSTGSGTGYDYTTIAYNVTTGSRLWVSRYDGPDHLDDSARAVGVAADGSRAFVVGSSNSTATGSDFATVGYSLT